MSPLYFVWSSCQNYRLKIGVVDSLLLLLLIGGVGISTVESKIRLVVKIRAGILVLTTCWSNFKSLNQITVMSQITRPRLAIRKKLDNRVLFGVEY